jgi:hypothetical protein
MKNRNYGLFMNRVKNIVIYSGYPENVWQGGENEKFI